MIYELRIYPCIPGRLPALLKRFENDTLKIWDKHGIKQAGFWTVLGRRRQPRSALPAGLGIACRPRDKWNAFQADPAWHKARDDSEKRRADHRQYQERVPEADGVLAVK